MKAGDVFHVSTDALVSEIHKRTAKQRHERLVVMEEAVTPATSVLESNPEGFAPNLKTVKALCARIHAFVTLQSSFYECQAGRGRDPTRAHSAPISGLP